MCRNRTGIKLLLHGNGNHNQLEVTTLTPIHVGRIGSNACLRVFLCRSRFWEREWVQPLIKAVCRILGIGDRLRPYLAVSRALRLRGSVPPTLSGLAVAGARCSSLLTRRCSGSGHHWLRSLTTLAFALTFTLTRRPRGSHLLLVLGAVDLTDSPFLQLLAEKTVYVGQYGRPVGLRQL